MSHTDYNLLPLNCEFPCNETRRCKVKGRTILFKLSLFQKLIGFLTFPIAVAAFGTLGYMLYTSMDVKAFGVFAMAFAGLCLFAWLGLLIVGRWVVLDGVTKTLKLRKRFIIFISTSKEYDLSDVSHIQLVQSRHGYDSLNFKNRAISSTRRYGYDIIALLNNERRVIAYAPNRKKAKLWGRSVADMLDVGITLYEEAS